MTTWSTADTYPKKLSLILAELIDQLRLSLAGNPPQTQSWPAFKPLAVQADLLKGVADLIQRPDMALLAETLSQLVTLAEDEPACMNAHLVISVERLVGFLDQILLDLDSGRALPEVLEDPAWDSLIVHFQDLGTPLQVMGQLQDELDRWQQQWCDGNLDVETEAHLKQRWLKLREYADALFCSQDLEAGESLLRWDDFGSSE